MIPISSFCYFLGSLSIASSSCYFVSISAYKFLIRVSNLFSKLILSLILLSFDVLILYKLMCLGKDYV